MKLYCRGRYHNNPAGLHFDGPGVVEIDEAKAEFLLRDAPDNFSVELPEPVQTAKAPDGPVADKMVREPRKKK